MSHLRDHSFRVVSIRGKVIGCVPMNATRPGRIRYVNIDRVQVVPPNISWNEINPRSKRNRTACDVRTWTHLSPPSSGLATEPNVLESASDCDSQGQPDTAERLEVQPEDISEKEGTSPQYVQPMQTEPEPVLRRSARILAKRAREPSPQEEYPPSVRQRIECLQSRWGNLNI